VYSAPGGQLLRQFEASGAAWGDGSSGPYGHDYPIPAGHYTLASFEHIDPPIASEGALQIDVADLSSDTWVRLYEAGLAHGTQSEATIGGVSLPLDGLANNGRSAIMIHGGGSNLGAQALDPDQQLCATEGCTRMHNQDLEPLLELLDGAGGTFPETVIFSVVGDPAPCSC